MLNSQRLFRRESQQKTIPPRTEALSQYLCLIQPAIASKFSWSNFVAYVSYYGLPFPIIICAKIDGDGVSLRSQTLPEGNNRYTQLLTGMNFC